MYQLRTVLPPLAQEAAEFAVQDTVAARVTALSAAHSLAGPTNHTFVRPSMSGTQHTL